MATHLQWQNLALKTMDYSAEHHLNAAIVGRLSAGIVFLTRDVAAGFEYEQSAHGCGEFVYSYSGVMEVKVACHHYLVPSRYGLWVPPGIGYQSRNRHGACHCALQIDPALIGLLPAEACALEVSPLIRSILEHLRDELTAPPYSPVQSRLLEVLVDQLGIAQPAGSYLPASADPLLSRVLECIEQNPGEGRPLSGLATQFHTTERTLMRRAKRHLGMPLTEWRQRLRTVKAVKLLEAGMKIESIALNLGYASSSSFIAMFKKLMGMTPDEYRRWVG